MENFLENNKVIDSRMSLAEALAQNPLINAPQEILERLALVSVQYYSFDGLLHEGQIVIDRRLEDDVRKIFEAIVLERFPVQAVIPSSDSQYVWDDGLLMSANVSSSFNYRTIAGTQTLSLHALGQAIDINPLLNPYIGVTGNVAPEGAAYDTTKLGTIKAGSFLVKLFTELGWEWGGSWEGVKDYQHFEKGLD